MLSPERKMCDNILRQYLWRNATIFTLVLTSLPPSIGFLWSMNIRRIFSFFFHSSLYILYPKTLSIADSSMAPELFYIKVVYL